MVQVLSTIINPEMAFTVIRQRIVDILEAELSNQFTLSLDDPVYSINVYQEKSNPWLSGQMPLVNVSYDSGITDVGSSSIARDQQGDHFYNLELYYQIPSYQDGDDINYGDVESKLVLQKGVSIIYQIIGADMNARLQFPARVAGKAAAFVGGRQFTEMVALQPAYGDHTVEDIAAFRLRLKVRHTELMPQIQGLELQGIDTTISRCDTTINTNIGINLDTP